MGIRQAINTSLFRHISIAPLVTFRVVFGLIMLASILRFWFNGWIEEQYIIPDFHFKYFGFYWVPNLPDWGYYLSFALMALSALGIALGAFYRISAPLFYPVYRNRINRRDLLPQSLLFSQCHFVFIDFRACSQNVFIGCAPWID